VDNLEQPLFSNRERDLMAEVARRLLPNLERVADRWAEAIKLDAPADKLPGMRQTLRRMTVPFLSGFFEQLSAGNPEGALAGYRSFIEGVIRGQLDEPERQRATIEALFSSARAVRDLLRLEIEQSLGGDEGRIAAVLPFSRLWGQAVESTGLIYARLREAHLRQLYDDARRTAEKLRESEERFRLVVEEAKDYAIWMADTAGRVASWNRGGEQMMGYAAGEIAGRHIACFFPPDERAAGKPEELIENARVHGRFETEGWWLRKDGSRFAAHLVIAALHDGTNRLLGFSMICRDTTEDKRRELELTLARDAALEASRLKSAFVANVTHEIHTPLNIILGYADLMAERLTELDDARAKDYADPVRRAGRRLLDTVGSILEISKIESGAYPLDAKPIMLAEFVERLLGEFKILAERKGLVLRAEIDEPQASVSFDEGCLANALTNLLQNAIKFTERGEVAVWLGRDARAALCLEVRDTGVGIEADYLPHIFEVFSQENPGLTRKFEGVGLGLSLVRKYLELNGAEIAVTSEKGRGSRFTIRFAPPTAASQT
jgi:PAS domain S-box-containing protein